MAVSLENPRVYQCSRVFALTTIFNRYLLSLIINYPVFQEYRSAMNLKMIIEKINLNQKKIQEHGKLSSDLLKKINYKFRLDWNYYSNRMEGGTLTREETRSVMIGNIDVHGKPLKDVMEMKGHDAMVLDILKMGKGEHRISQKRIKEIHVSIMQEDDPQKKSEIGQWKSRPNELINYKGEKIPFTSPTEVPDAIHDLLNKTNAQLDAFFGGKSVVHPLEIAAQFHIEFVSIHPFYDGNGRTTRILTNLILISCGFPPIIIKEIRKQSYYQLLADIQVYNGDSELFQVFLGERLLESQQLVLDAIDGKSIEEEDDLDKEIILWKQEIHKDDAPVQPRSDEKIVQIYLESIRPLFKAYIDKTKQFDDLFIDKFIYNSLGSKKFNVEELEYFDNWIYLKNPSLENSVNTSFSLLETSLMLNNIDEFSKKYSNEEFERSNEMRLEISFRGFKNNGADSFDEYLGFKVELEQYSYRVLKDRHSNTEIYKKLYSEKLTPSEIESFVKESVREAFENMKKRVGNSSGKTN